MASPQPQTSMHSILDNIISDTNRVLVINGCAGSRKTDAAVLFALARMKSNKHVMMLTKVTSVTHETTSRLTSYGNVTFTKQGNHYFTQNIEVANMDAMVHDQLRRLGHDVNGQRGESHKWKCETYYNTLLQNGQDKRLYAKNNQIVDVLIVDEFQDFEESTIKLIFEVVKQNNHMQLVVFGDIMQTIFCISNIHPMNAIKSAFPGQYTNHLVNMCWRCPKAHIDFVNTLHAKHLHQYGLPPLVSANEDNTNKPVLFAHLGITHNTGAMLLAKTIAKTVKTLLNQDPELHPRDVAIIMRVANHNKVFTQLETFLNIIYRRMGYSGPDSKVGARVFETKGDMQHIAIDWNSASDKTVMLSVHGDKGKGHKVVFFLGYAEKSIPLAHHLFKDIELLDQSLSYVALTRSVKHLFIGFPYTCPSRYLLNSWQKLIENKLAILAWVPSTYETHLHHAVCEKLAFVKPHESLSIESATYIKEPIFRPHRLVFTVTDLAMQAFEHYLDILPEWDAVCTQKRKVFGKYHPAPRSVRNDETKRCVYGMMGELMLEREYRITNNTLHEMKQTFKQCFVNENKIMYTDDEEILCFAYDIKINMRNLSKLQLTNEVLYILEDCMLSDKLKALFEDLKQNPKYILPTALDGHTFKDSLKKFFDDKLQLHQVPSACLWNVAIGKSIIMSQVRRPSMNTMLDWFHEPIDGLVYNTKKLVESMSQDAAKHAKASSRVKFNTNRDMVVRVTDNELLQTMGFSDKVNCVSVGIIGIDDFSTHKCIYEVKCPVNKIDISSKWVLQALLYACIGDSTWGQQKHKTNYNRIAICDLTRGVITSFKFKDGIPSQDILMQYLQYMELSPELVDYFGFEEEK